jgi:flavin-dependent dehydrogenase
MTPDYDVVIVGGGPCGAATSLFLCEALGGRDARVLLIDRASFPREKICAGAIGARADRMLESIGVTIHVPGVAIHGLGVTAAPARVVERLDGAPIGRVIRRRAFDAALLDRAREGVEVREGVAFEGLTTSARTVKVSTSAGELTTRALVGADGVASRVRRALGMGRGLLYAQAVEVDCPMQDDDTLRDVLHFDISDRSFAGYAWDFPTLVDGEPQMCRGVYELRHGGPDPAGQPVNVATRLRRYLEARGVAHEGLRFKQFAERGLPLHRPFARERVLLAGEAAGIDPVLGEGIAQAILYGATAGRYLARCLEQGDLRFGDWRRTLTASRVGLDLKIRTALLPWVYGPRTRQWVERYVTSSTNLLTCGMEYFAGRRVNRRRLGRAALDLVGAL